MTVFPIFEVWFFAYSWGIIAPFANPKNITKEMINKKTTRNAGR
jgi:hypothetical protein